MSSPAWPRAGTPDDTTYVMKLRQGVLWHDGSEFTADDVKYSLERLLAPETPVPTRPGSTRSKRST
jgi:peptide/nickel transport system substrate-binding protein